VLSESETTMQNSIYLALAWKLSIFSGFHAYMTLIEHSDQSVSLESGAVKKLYYQHFCDKLGKPKEPIIYSSSLNENIPFTISAGMSGKKISKLDVEIKAGRNESRPM
jgi:hypothetical protein